MRPDPDESPALLEDPLRHRLSGVLLHPTSLPGPGSIGTLGRPALDFVEFLVEARQHLWQMLPVGPTHADGSPYRALSALAGNTWLLSDEALPAPLAPTPDGPQRANRVDFAAAQRRADALVAAAHHEFRDSARGAELEAFATFREREADWLDDFSLYVALREHFQRRVWFDWPTDLVRRDPDVLAAARAEHADAIEAVAYGQFLFEQQWQALHAAAEARGIGLVGDIPIYVDIDSVDVWAHQELFELGPDGRPTAVAGVPPDYFSKTGQRWGNPLYRWDVMAERGFEWWIGRFARCFDLFHLARIDHFRGFEAYWRVPAHEETAVRGEWVPGPGEALFRAVAEALGRLPVIAEDLGMITEAVRKLRTRLGLPGMKILQFAFDGEPDNPFLPANIPRLAVVYPGTHDNDTTAGWYAKLSDTEREGVHAVLDEISDDPAWALIEAAWRSRANLAVATLQDLLGLDSGARMNFPGKSEGNWVWRLDDPAAYTRVAPRLAKLTVGAGRS